MRNDMEAASSLPLPTHWCDWICHYCIQILEVCAMKINNWGNEAKSWFLPWNLHIQRPENKWHGDCFLSRSYTLKLSNKCQQTNMEEISWFFLVLSHAKFILQTCLSGKRVRWTIERIKDQIIIRIKYQDMIYKMNRDPKKCRQVLHLILKYPLEPDKRTPFLIDVKNFPLQQTERQRVTEW